MGKYVYPAIFTKEADGQYSIEFPDIPYAHSCGENLADAMYMAEDCLGFVLLDLQNDKKRNFRLQVIYLIIKIQRIVLQV